jgi:hypothetical protein
MILAWCVARQDSGFGGMQVVNKWTRVDEAKLSRVSTDRESKERERKKKGVMLYCT